MSNETRDTPIEIMGKMYNIKCPENEVPALRRAAEYLHNQMLKMRETGILSADTIAVMAALNLAHELFTLEQNKNQDIQIIHQRLSALQTKVEQALEQSAQMELTSAG